MELAITFYLDQVAIQHVLKPFRYVKFKQDPIGSIFSEIFPYLALMLGDKKRLTNYVGEDTGETRVKSSSLKRDRSSS